MSKRLTEKRRADLVSWVGHWYQAARKIADADALLTPKAKREQPAAYKQIIDVLLGEK